MRRMAIAVAFFIILTPLALGLEIPKGGTANLRLFLEAPNGTPASPATCKLDVYYPNDTIQLNDQVMTDQGNGVYNYTYTAPSQPLGDYYVIANCSFEGDYASRSLIFSVVERVLPEEIKVNATKEIEETESFIKENITQELQNRWQDLNASYLNGTAIERVRKLADYLNQTRWGRYIASDLYDISEKAKNISKYINQSRWIDVNASELKSISVRARNLADYINGTRWGKYVAEDLRNMSDKARKIAEYINETRWKGFVAKDIFAEAELARKEAERTYEEMHDLKRVLIKEMRKTVLRALGIKGPGSHSSSSSSSGGSSSVPSSSPKTLPTGKATRSKSRGIVGKTVHFFARGVRGLSLIAQSVMGG